MITEQLIRIAYDAFRLATFSEWSATSTTRLGASFADWLGKPHSAHGLGLGDGPVALALTAAIFALVAYLAITRRDIQLAARAHRRADAPRARFTEPAPEAAD